MGHASAHTNLPKPTGAPPTPLVSLAIDPRVQATALLPPGPWDPTEYELWVERGVVWDLKRHVTIGFIDYPSIAPFFKQTHFTEHRGVLNGSPFSMHDFPIYGIRPGQYSFGYVTQTIFWIFSKLHTLQFIPNAYGRFVQAGLAKGSAPPPGSGPMATAQQMRSFIAQTSNGRKTFSAQYVYYAPPAQYWPGNGLSWPWWPTPWSDLPNPLG